MENTRANIQSDGRRKRRSTFRQMVSLAYVSDMPASMKVQILLDLALETTHLNLFAVLVPVLQWLLCLFNIFLVFAMSLFVLARYCVSSGGTCHSWMAYSKLRP